jgi:hypothetical protein
VTNETEIMWKEAALPNFGYYSMPGETEENHGRQSE